MYTFLIMPFYVYAWLASLLTGLGAIVGKLSSKHQISNPWFYNFVWSLLIVLFTLPFALAAHPHWPTHWAMLWMVGFFSAATGLLFILSLRLLDISVLGPLYNFRTAVSLVLGIFLFHERLSGYQLGLIVLILVAGIFVTMDERFSIRSFFHTSIFLALIAVTGSAILGASVKYVRQFEGYWEVMLWSNVLGQILLLPTVWLFWRDLRNVRWHQWSGAFGHALFSTFGWMAMNAAYAVNISISTAIISLPLSMIWAFLFSIFAPKLLEKHSMKIYAIRFSAAAIMVLAALRLSG